MDIYQVLTFVGGLALFLYGMKVLGDGLEKRAGAKLKGILERLTSNPIKGALLGAGVTAVIQSSSATTVMVVGFVNSGIMKLNQAIGVILGAKVGTTMTSWILSLTGIQGESLLVNLLKPSSFSPVLALIGIILLLFARKNKHKDTGTIMLGFAVLMFGMETMSGAVSPLAKLPEFQQILLAFRNPLLGVLVGAAFTGIIQSSSASVGILQALAMTGTISFSVAMPIILGQNIGTCITALLSSFGTNRAAKRAAFSHLYISILGTAVFMGAYYLADAIFVFPFDNAIVSAVDIAVIHTIYNVFTMLVFLPFVNQIEKTVCVLLPDRGEKQSVAFLDRRLLATPSIAVSQCERLTREMSFKSEDALAKAICLIGNYDEKTADEIDSIESHVDIYEDKLGTFLVELGAKDMSETDSREAQELLHLIGDLERISDHALNICESAQEMRDKNINFSPTGEKHLKVMSDAVLEILALSMRAFREKDLLAAHRVEPLEQVIDKLKKQLRDEHVLRLQSGECKMTQGYVFNDLLTDLERVSDHCSNMAACVAQTSEKSMAVHSYTASMKAGGEHDYKMVLAEFEKKYSLD